MLKNNLVIIGALGRNAGKTELACRIIHSLKQSQDVIALKVTTIKEDGESCPRGGRGCGVCSSLKGNFELTEEVETLENKDKDTIKMLRAGAKKVYWLRVLKSCLKEGIEHFLKEVGEDKNKIIVCESNSLRLVVEPGLFLVCRGSLNESPKTSCQEVLKYADRIVDFEKDKFDFDLSPDAISFRDQKWFIKEAASAVVLAGGNSLRMKQDKALLSVKYQPLIKVIIDQLNGQFDEILISANEKEKYAFLKLPMVADVESGKGPLMGIYSALQQSKNEINFVVACDIPELNMPFIRDMVKLAKNFEAVVPISQDERKEPLFAVYRKSIAEKIKDMLDKGEKKVSKLFDLVKTKYVPMPEPDTWYKNLNETKEYQDYIRKGE